MVEEIKTGTIYYRLYCYPEWGVSECVWKNSYNDKRNKKQGNFYRTREEAVSNLPTKA